MSRVIGVTLGLILCLIAGSDLRVVGDGGEYVMQALNFAAGHGPAITEADGPRLRDEVAGVAPFLSNWDPATSGVLDAAGRLDFYHFWFYALLASPLVGLATAVGANPLLGFTLLNVALFVVAIAVVLPRAGLGATLLVFGGPVIWWLDKAHTEVFTFSLLAIGVTTFAGRPWWSFVAFGAAATQNPPIAVLLPVALALRFVGDRTASSDRRLLAGAAAGGLLVLVHLGYTYARHGVPSLLLLASNPGLPSLAETTAFVVDPVIGLVPNFPALALAVIAACWLVWRHGWRDEQHRGELILAAVAALTFLYAFGRTSNFHHGATASMSRYALWLVPLALPLLWRAFHHGGTAWRRALLATAMLSTAVNVVVFHPRVEENSREPTWLAAWLWTAHPSWNNPLPEVFAETLARQENPELPIATAGCEKVLTAGRESATVWPIPCYPAEVPDDCRRWGATCYGNLGPEGYAFVPTPGRRDSDALIARQRVWPSDALRTARRLFESMGWQTLEPEGDGAEQIRAIHGVSAFVLAGGGRLLVVLHQPGPGARLRLRTARPVRGVLVDPRTNAVLLDIRHPGNIDDLWDIEVSETLDLQILTLEESSS